MTTTPETKIATAGDYIRQELDQAANAFEKQHEHYKTENYLGAAFCGHITQSAFAVVALLETLRRIDPAQADRFAVWLDECQLDGQAAGELWWQWREQLNAGEPMTDVGPGDEPADLTTDQKVPDAACGAVREETGIRCGEPAGHTDHHKGTSTDEHGEHMASLWSNTEADHG